MTLLLTRLTDAVIAKLAPSVAGDSPGSLKLSMTAVLPENPAELAAAHTLPAAHLASIELTIPTDLYPDEHEVPATVATALNTGYRPGPWLARIGQLDPDLTEKPS